MKNRFYRDFPYPNEDFILKKFHDGKSFILQTPLWVEEKNTIKKLRTLPGCIGVISADKVLWKKPAAHQFFFACSMPREELYDYLPTLISDISGEPPQVEEEDLDQDSTSTTPESLSSQPHKEQEPLLSVSSLWFASGPAIHI